MTENQPAALPEVQHNPLEKRFEVELNGDLAVLEYKMDAGKLIATHTGVPVALEGKGIASRLARAALEYARAHELKVVPLCSFMAGCLSVQLFFDYYSRETFFQHGNKQ